MTLSSDLREFVESLNSRGIDYVIVGAHSLAFHSRPRYTGDLDILVRCDADNARKVVTLLKDFRFEGVGITESDFTEPGQIIQLGRPPDRIDLLTSITGVDNEEVFAGKQAAELDGIPVSIMSKEALIRNKRAVGRPQDIADLKELDA